MPQNGQGIANNTRKGQVICLDINKLNPKNIPSPNIIINRDNLII